MNGPLRNLSIVYIKDTTEWRSHPYKELFTPHAYQNPTTTLLEPRMLACAAVKSLETNMNAILAVTF